MPMFEGRYAEYPDPGLWHRVRFWGPQRIRNAWWRLSIRLRGSKPPKPH
ncbi:hypothetical protein APR09_002748 [Nocardia amikacinitolerans]|nr:hypothetical protein [Nocardia amikacinitolerans]